MSIRDHLLRNELTKPSNPDDSTVNEYINDEYITEKPYKRWMPGIRTLLRLRYLALKKAVLKQNKQALEYEVSAKKIQQQIAEGLIVNTRQNSFWPVLLNALMRRWVLIPALFALAAATVYLILSLHKNALDREVFKQKIPKYSDTVYLVKAARPTNSGGKKNRQLQAELETLKQDIVNHFKKYPSVNEKLKSLLDAVEEKDFPPQEMFALTKKLNDELFINRIPYYLSPTVETADCEHLPLTAFLERLFASSQVSGELCIVYVLLTFHVEEHRYYNADGYNHLAFFTRRLDQLDINNNILGKVHLGDNTAQILVGNIDASSANSTVAINEGALKNRLMPQGMQDVYGLESIARRLQTRVLNIYTDELKNTWQWKLSRAYNKLRKRESHVLPAATAKLQRRIADVTAFHEVQHLIDQFNDLEEPVWLQETLSELTRNVAITPQFQKSVLWELSAFFTHLANAEELKGILLNEFTAITLNPMLQDQPHYYSIRMLLPILQAMHEGSLGTTPPAPAMTLADIARHYKFLSQHTDQLGTLARDAYQVLFNEELPFIVETKVATRVVDTVEATPQ